MSLETAYRGPDRLGIIHGNEPSASLWSALWAVLAVAALPVAALLLLSLLGASVASWSNGVADTAFVAYGLSAAFLLLRWRLVGEAPCFDLFAAATLLGILVVPTSNELGASPALYVTGLRNGALLAVAALGAFSLRSPEVRSDLRAGRSLLMAWSGAPLVALVLAETPARALLEPRGGGLQVLYLFEATVLVVLAVGYMRQGVDQARLVKVAFGAALLSAAGASSASASSLRGPWEGLPVLILSVGAVLLAVAAGGDLRSAVETVAARWRAAEGSLSAERRSYQGQRHDLEGMLSALDGSLYVLANHRDELPPEQVHWLIKAMRDDVRLIEMMVRGRSQTARSYDLCEVLRSVVSVQRGLTGTISCEAESAVEVEGHPDRVAVVVNNLLVNAASYAQGAAVRAGVRALPVEEGASEMVELYVADEGPGMEDDELALAAERGWRGSGSRGTKGSGLGLAQCEELVTREGGELLFVPTRPSAPPGGRGLTVLVRLPRHCRDEALPGRLSP